jgi:hypothetical protein
MVTLGITKAITNLTEAHARLGILPSPDTTWFTEWKAPLPAQTLAYMVGAPISPVFALITTGEDYLFVKYDRDAAHYALSDKFTLSTAAGNELHTVAQILKRLGSIP